MELISLLGLFAVFIGIILLFAFGLSLIIGAGWTFIIIDLLTQNTSGVTYDKLQNDFPGGKTITAKVSGIVLIIFSILGFFYILPRFL